MEEEEERYMRRHVFPQAPSPTMTNFLRMDSVIVVEESYLCLLGDGVFNRRTIEEGILIASIRGME